MIVRAKGQVMDLCGGGNQPVSGIAVEILRKECRRNGNLRSQWQKNKIVSRKEEVEPGGQRQGKVDAAGANEIGYFRKGK